MIRIGAEAECDFCGNRWPYEAIVLTRMVYRRSVGGGAVCSEQEILPPPGWTPVVWKQPDLVLWACQSCTARSPSIDDIVKAQEKLRARLADEARTCWTIAESHE
jgi:hypothetical protein